MKEQVSRAECEAIISAPSWWLCTKCGWHGAVKPESHGVGPGSCPYEPIETAHIQKRLARAHIALLDECESLRESRDRAFSELTAMENALKTLYPELRRLANVAQMPLSTVGAFLRRQEAHAAISENAANAPCPREDGCPGKLMCDEENCPLASSEVDREQDSSVSGAGQ